MSGWLSYPLPPLDGSRTFSCEADGFAGANCTYYQERWHFWYHADWVFALPTVAFFMCAIGIFIIGNVINQVLSHTGDPTSALWRRAVAGTRYLSYRGFHVRALRWNSAPVGLLLLALIGTIYFFLMDLVPQPYYWPDLSWGNSPPLGTRSGWLSLACMPFVFATASKANWITLVTGVSHERLQTFHRWTAYAFFVLALMHTFPFIVFHINNGDMVMQVTKMNTFEYWTGIVAIIFQAFLTMASHSVFRSMGYEVFKFSHFFSVAVFVVVFFWHCNATLTSWNYFVASASLYVSCFVYSWIRTIVEYGGWKDAKVTIENNDFIRVDIPVVADWVPGQHCFLRFSHFGMRVLSSHPFTICSLPSRSPDKASEMTFYMRRRGGFTARLYNLAQKLPGGTIPVLIDGPYGGIGVQKFVRNERSVIVAGGSGAGWALPFVTIFAQRQAELAEMSMSDVTDASSDDKLSRRSKSLQSLRVILATRDTATRVWFRTAVDAILQSHPPIDKEVRHFELEVYLTGEAEEYADSPAVLKDLEKFPSHAQGSASSDSDSDPKQKQELTGDEARGRPHIPSIVRKEADKSLAAGQALGLYVCGPDTMQNDARNAAAKANIEAMKQGKIGVHLHTEHFSWA